MSEMRASIILELIEKVQGPARRAREALRDVSGEHKELANKINAVKKSREDVAKVRNDIDAFRKLKTEVKSSSEALAVSQERTKAAAIALKTLSSNADASAKEIKKAQREFNAARREAQQLKASIDSQNTTLEQMRRGLHSAGVSTKSLSGSVAQLAARERDLIAAQSKQVAMLEQQRKKTEALQKVRDAFARGSAKAAVAGVAGYGAMNVGQEVMQAAKVPVMQSANLSDSVNDIAITGGMGKAEEAVLKASIRDIALKTNQEQSEIANGIKILIANGMKYQDASSYAELQGVVATATRAQMEDISNVTFSLQNNLKIQGEAAMSEAMSSLVYAGKLGQFELKEMAKYLPSLSAQMASMGATGQDAVKELGVSMQAARKAAGTSQEAAANMANWFSHMTATSTIDGFESAGIDYKKEIQARMQHSDPQKRMSALGASIDVFDSYIDKLTEGQTVTFTSKTGKVKEVLNFRQALEKATKDGNQDEVSRIVERFGLSNVIQDMQTANFYLAMRQNKEFMDESLAKFDSGEAKNVLVTDFQRRMDSPIEQYKTAKLELAESLTEVGDAIVPALTPLLSILSEITMGFTAWAQENPDVVKGVAMAVLVIGALSAAVGAVLMVIAPLVIGFLGLRVAMTALPVLGIGRALTMLSSGAGIAGRMLMVATIGIRAMGAALIANPLGLAIAAIAAAAWLGYYAWKNWDTIGPRLKSGFDGAFSSISGRMSGWVAEVKQNPAKIITMFATLPFRLAQLGLDAINGFVKGVWGIDLYAEAGKLVDRLTAPIKNISLVDIGRNIIQGLANGMGDAASVVVDKAKSIAENIASNVRSFFGIKSPSRLMMQYGGFISEGLGVGISDNDSSPVKAMRDVAHRVNASFGDAAANDSVFRHPIAATVMAGVIGAGAAMPLAAAPTIAAPVPSTVYPASPQMMGQASGATTINITINAAPGQSPEALARAVSAELDRRERQRGVQRRSALHDGAIR